MFVNYMVSSQGFGMWWHSCVYCRVAYSPSDSYWLVPGTYDDA
jgi:hypothetical protein